METIAVIIATDVAKRETPTVDVNYEVCGKPLIYWKIRQAQHAKNVGSVHVVSDSPEILKLADRFGVVPIKKKLDVQLDQISKSELIQQDIEKVLKAINASPEAIVYMKASAPLFLPADIDNAIEAFVSKKADCLVTVTRILNENIWERNNKDIICTVNFESIEDSIWDTKKRQLFQETGSFYLINTEFFQQARSIFSGKTAFYEIPYWKSLDAANEDHIEFCKYLFEKKGLPEKIDPMIHRSFSAKEIELVVYDFDGVMTDNRAVVRQDGLEAVIVNRGDGLGIGMLKKLGIPQIILSTETNPVVTTRANKLAIEAISGCKNKKEALKAYCKEKSIALKKTLFVGNDLNDYEVMQSVGFPIAPNDAHFQIKNIACYVTSAKGGEGVIRELADRFQGDEIEKG